MGCLFRGPLSRRFSCICSRLVAFIHISEMFATHYPEIWMAFHAANISKTASPIGHNRDVGQEQDERSFNDRG
jgi:hypothetical protein